MSRVRKALTSSQYHDVVVHANVDAGPSGFVFDPRTGATFSLNETGRLLLEGIRDGHGLKDLTDTLSSHFDAGAADLCRDVFEFVRLLQGQGLLAANFELGA